MKRTVLKRALLLLPLILTGCSGTGGGSSLIGGLSSNPASDSGFGLAGEQAPSQVRLSSISPAAPPAQAELTTPKMAKPKFQKRLAPQTKVARTAIASPKSGSRLSSKSVSKKAAKPIIKLARVKSVIPASPPILEKNSLPGIKAIATRPTKVKVKKISIKPRPDTQATPGAAVANAPTVEGARGKIASRMKFGESLSKQKARGFQALPIEHKFVQSTPRF